MEVQFTGNLRFILSVAHNYCNFNPIHSPARSVYSLAYSTSIKQF